MKYHGRVSLIFLASMIQWFGLISRLYMLSIDQREKANGIEEVDKLSCSSMYMIFQNIHIVMSNHITKFIFYFNIFREVTKLVDKHSGISIR